jgi:sulfoxide reductase heme-binding subunit YedZ
MAKARTRNSLEGWGLLRSLILLVAFWTLATWLIGGIGVDGIRAAIRATARSSLFLFLAAFAASSLHQLWPNDLTKWLRRNRRQLGLGFAFSHLVHAGLIIAFWRLDPDTFLIGRTPASFIAPGLAYLAIFAMAATSFDRTARAVGPRAWKWIHTIGAWYIFIIFTGAFASRVAATPAYSSFVALLAAALGLRIMAALRKRRARPGRLAA